MQISYNWLKNFIPEFEIPSLDTLKNKLDTRLSEVDSIELKGEGLANIVIAQIIDVQAHPTNAHLHVCEVDAGEAQHRTIVCGAENARAGLKTIACLPGGKVYNPKDQHQTVDIGQRKMGDIMSDGMLCSPAELGLGSHHEGIIELSENSKIGTPIASMLRDIVIEIENKNLAHRPDAFSHLGIAREISAIFKTRFEERIPNLAKASAEEKVEYKITIQDTEACPRYSGIRINGIKVGPSPLWLQIAVSYAGLRSINNIVDITNYIMLDVGQPLHAFDASKLESNEIIVRKSKPNEILTTLDGQKRKLPTGTLVIADRSHPVAIAGIMGGESTAVTAETQDIFLESANFEMYGIRRSSRELGLRTDASSRYEKGLDPALAEHGLAKAVEMILDVCGGELCCDTIDVYPNPEQPKVVVFNLNAVKRLQGIELDKSKLIDLLSSINLEMEKPERISADAMMRADLTTEVNILVPSYRRDIKAQEDILEEIARLYGYENIQPSLPKRDLEAPQRNKRVDTILNSKKSFAASGLYEIYTYTMVGEQLYKDALTSTDDLWKVTNPISPELSMIRDRVAPSLLAKLKPNMARYDSFGLFEISRVATKQKQAEGIPVQPYHMAAVFVAGTDLDAYRFLRQALDNFNSSVCNNKLAVVQNGRKGDLEGYLHPGKYAAIELGNETIGQIGILHPLVKSNFDIAGDSVAVMEIKLDKILDMEQGTHSFRSLSSFQPVIRDISFWQPDNSRIGELLAMIQQAGISFLQQVEMQDVFTTKENRTSVTVRLTMQAGDHTLTQAEIGEATEKAIAVAQKQSYQLRS